LSISLDAANTQWIFVKMEKTLLNGQFQIE